jgi:hypothetical protein
MFLKTTQKSKNQQNLNRQERFFFLKKTRTSFYPQTKLHLKTQSLYITGNENGHLRQVTNLGNIHSFMHYFPLKQKEKQPFK